MQGRHACPARQEIRKRELEGREDRRSNPFSRMKVPAPVKFGDSRDNVQQSAGRR